jgi:hypothetical protein
MENRYLLKRVPDFYDRLKRSYDEKFYEQEVLGKYLSIHGGAVYHAFNRGEHVGAVEIQPKLPLMWALDFNVDPMCSIVAQIVKEDIHVLDEIVIRRATTQEACEEFHRRFPYHAAGVCIYGDATGNKMQTSGTTDYQMIRGFFQSSGYPNVSYRVPKSNPLTRERVALVNAKLRSASGEKHLLISGKCSGLARDLEEVCYKPDTAVIDKDKDLQRTHLSDALGYLVWEECGPHAPVGERGDRLT